MNTHVDKTQKNKNQSMANAVFQNKSVGESLFKFVDNGPEAVVQRKLRELVNNNPQVRQLRAFQEIVNNSTQSNQSARMSAMANHFTKNQRHPIQMVNGNHPMKDDDLNARIRNLKAYRSKRARLDQERRRQQNAKLVMEFEERYYRRTYKGKDAVIAAIINKVRNPPRADYGVDLYDGAISKMNDISLPVDLSPDEIVNRDTSFKTAVLKAYDDEVGETSGKTDTQLGLHADNFTYT